MIQAVFKVLAEAAACVLSLAIVFWSVVFLGRLVRPKRRYSKVRLKPASRSVNHGPSRG